MNEYERAIFDCEILEILARRAERAGDDELADDLFYEAMVLDFDAAAMPEDQKIGFWEAINRARKLMGEPQRIKPKKRRE